MIETSKDWVNAFIDYAEPDDDFTGVEFVLLRKDATEPAKEAYQKYIKFISHGLLSWDDLVIENRRIVGISPTATGKSKAQCELVMRLIDDGWIDNDPFIKEGI